MSAPVGGWPVGVVDRLLCCRLRAGVIALVDPGFAFAVDHGLLASRLPLSVACGAAAAGSGKEHGQSEQGGGPNDDAG